jgi:hypothetical protein
MMLVGLNRTLKGPEFASVRGQALDQFPPKERLQWQKLWEDMRQVIKILKTRD